MWFKGVKYHLNPNNIYNIFLLKDMRNLIMALVNVYLYIYNKISKSKDCNKRITKSETSLSSNPL